MEYFSAAPAVFLSPTPVVEYFSPTPAVFHATAPVSDFTVPVPVESPSAVTGGDRQASVPGQSSTALRGATSCECLFFTTGVMGRGSHAMLLRRRSTGKVRFEMLHLEDQTVAYQCDVAALRLKKPPGREESWLLVGQERFFFPDGVRYGDVGRHCACFLELLSRSPWWRRTTTY